MQFTSAIDMAMRYWIFFTFCTTFIYCQNETDFEYKGLLDYLLGNGPRFCPCTCGRISQRSRIIGGEYAEVNDNPWLVLINMRENATVVGTLINDRYVLTSASQVLGLTPYDIKVTLGEYNRCSLDVTSTNQSVDAINIHPEYDPLNRGSDLALIRLSTPTRMDRWISSICLPQPGSEYLGTVSRIAGWGIGPLENGTIANTCRPRFVSLPILSQRQCEASSSIAGLMTSDHGCAGVVGSQAVVCSSDSGSPVAYLGRDGFFELIGVITNSNDCSSTSPALFTRVNEHFPWIFQMTRDACYCSKKMFR